MRTRAATKAPMRPNSMSLKAAFPLTSCTTELTPAVSRQPSSPNSRLEAYRERTTCMGGSGEAATSLSKPFCSS